MGLTPDETIGRIWLRFLQEYAALPERLPIRAERLPTGMAPGCVAVPLQEHKCGTAIRLGPITDRFAAGHKLKTLAYIAANQIVLSFTDVSADFTAIPDHAFFIRRVASVSDIAVQVREVAAADPMSLRLRLEAFKNRCAEVFTWDAVGVALTAAAVRATRNGHPANAPSL